MPAKLIGIFAYSILGGLFFSQIAAAQPPYSVVVGRFQSIEEIECESGEDYDPDTGEALITICMDSLYLATYRVEQSLVGEFVAGAVIEFRVADHYGFPEFARFKTALLFLSGDRENLYHVKYRWGNAYATASGRFAECGCTSNIEDEESACSDVVFDPPVTVDLRQASGAVIADYVEDEAYDVRGDTAVCTRGQYVESYYKPLLDLTEQEYRNQLRYCEEFGNCIGD